MGFSLSHTVLLILVAISITTTNATIMKLYKKPLPLSSKNSAVFAFEVLEEGWNGVDGKCKVYDFISILTTWHA